jgi:hypothetical protein
MGDSQQPKSVLPQFEVPDLELKPAPHSKRPMPAPANAPNVSEIAREYRAQNLFDDDAFSAGGPTIDLEDDAESGALHLAARPDARRESTPSWPNGQVPARERLRVDPVEVSLFARYGEPPKSVHLTPLYAYRVFARQREIKHALGRLEAERQRAEAELESVLAQLARAVRPEAEGCEQFQRLFAPLIALEQVASQRGQSLSAVNAELSARTAAFDAELTALSEQLAVEQARERDAQRLYDDRDAAAQRADAKVKRVQIEVRAVMQVAEKKLGPQGGAVPEPEATQLAALKLRAEAAELEGNQAKAELQQAKLTLDRASARVGATRSSERSIGRKKQTLVQRYHEELELRGRGQHESQEQQRTALADLGRAVLAGRGTVPVPDAWLERVRSCSQRADALLLECELHSRALIAYDRTQVAQGVRLTCTLTGLFVLLILLKLAL